VIRRYAAARQPTSRAKALRRCSHPRGWIHGRVTRQRAVMAARAEIRAPLYTRAELLAARAHRKAHAWFTSAWAMV
jgi:hypothetical protein